MKKIYSLFVAAIFYVSSIQAQTIIPTTDEVLLPSYAYAGGTLANRLPFVCRLKLTGLTPNAQYRYMVGMSSTNNLNTTQAPGNMYNIRNAPTPLHGSITGLAVTKAINSSELNNDVLINTSSSYHARFTADANGTFTGWFGCVPTANATQQAVGSDVYFYVHLNNGAGGTTLTQSYRTTSTIKLLDYSTTTNDNNGCTGLLGTSNVGDEKMVAIYDNEAAKGRPIYCTFTESNGFSEGGTGWWENPLLYASVDGVSGSWAAIVPNTLTGGIKAITFYNSDATLVALSNAPNNNTSANGVWNGVATTNPSGGATTPITINSIAGTSLPVQLLSFNAALQKHTVSIHWSTTQERNNKHFNILRAGADGKFVTIGTVSAAINASAVNNYSFEDKQPLKGKNLYQLQQVDVDGSVSLSKIVSVINGTNNGNIKIVKQTATEVVIGIEVSSTINAQLMYTNTAGSILYSKQTILNTGYNQMSIPMNSIKQMGIITLRTNDGLFTQVKILP